VSGTLSGSATITGYTNPTTYILTAVTTTTATLTTTAGAAVVTTAGTTTGLTFTLGAAPVTVTVSGYDYYGQAMSEAITSSAAVSTTVSGLKAFYQISSIAVSGATGTAVTAGTTDVLGCPVRFINKGYVSHVGWADVLVEDAATAVVADTATATTTSTSGASRDSDKLSAAETSLLLGGGVKYNFSQSVGATFDYSFFGKGVSMLAAGVAFSF
jgi:hypothetical protein